MIYFDMKTKQFSDAYWTAHFAPYVFIVAVVALTVSLFWILPHAGYLLIGVLSGVIVLIFHILRWRSGREIFQVAAIAAGILPLFFVLSQLHGTAAGQYVATFIISYTAGVLILRRRILRTLNRDV